MKILHTSDWHLGKKLFKVSRLPEQRLFLDWLEKILIDQEIDALVMAGDVFDTPHPPHDALEVYYHFLDRVGKLGKQVFVIAGNHDSGRFLQAPQAFLGARGIHVAGRFPHAIEFNANDHVFTLKEKNRQWHIHLLPFFRSHEVLEYVHARELISTEEFPRLLLEMPEQLIETGLVDALKRFQEYEETNDQVEHRRMLVAHHLFGGFRLAGSEQSVTISGLDGLPTSMWGLPYDDLALGHIHQTQQLRETAPRAIYPGSPIRFRFNERREKKVSLLTWDDNGHRQEYIQVPEFRPVISLQLKQENFAHDLEQALKNEPLNTELAGLLEVRIKVEGAPVGLADQIRQVLNQFESKWELLSLQIEGAAGALDNNDKDRAHIITNFNSGNGNMEELFKLYYKKKFPNQDEPSQTLLEDFKSLIQGLGDS